MTVGAWAVIAAHVIVTAGTTIGEAALVGAGAVVTHDVGECEVVAGVPARAILVDGRRAVPAGGTGTPVT